MIPASITGADLTVGVFVVVVLAVIAAYALYEAVAVIWRHVATWRARRRARKPWPIPYDRREELSIAAPVLVTLVLSALFLGAIVSCWRAIP